MAVDTYLSLRTALHPNGDPVAGAYVSIHEESGVLLAFDTTDADGLAFLGNRDAGTYEVRITPVLPFVAVSSRMALVVVDDGSDFIAEALAYADAVTPAPNADLCRCHGYFIDGHGRPAAGVSLQFTETDCGFPVIATSRSPHQAIIPRDVEVSADSTGHVHVDLLRGWYYDVVVSSYQTTVFTIQVPDLPYANLPDVIFPLPTRVEYVQPNGAVVLPADAPAVAMNVGDVLELGTRLYFTSGVVYEPAQSISYLSSDESALQVALSETGITLTAVAAGNYTVDISLSGNQDGWEPGFVLANSDNPILLGTLNVQIS